MAEQLGQACTGCAQVNCCSCVRERTEAMEPVTLLSGVTSKYVKICENWTARSGSPETSSHISTPHSELGQAAAALSPQQPRCVPAPVPHPGRPTTPCLHPLGAGHTSGPPHRADPRRHPPVHPKCGAAPDGGAAAGGTGERGSPRPGAPRSLSAGTGMELAAGYKKQPSGPAAVLPEPLGGAGARQRHHDQPQLLPVGLRQRQR